MTPQLAPFHVFLSAFVIAALGGLAGFLRSNQEVNPRGVMASVLYSGLMGLIIALLWHNYFEGQANIYFLLGIAGLAGIGGVSVVDFVIRVAKRGGLHITITPSPGDETGVAGTKGGDEDKGDDNPGTNQGSGDR